MGIMVDIGAVEKTTYGLGQFVALQRLQKAKLNRSHTGKAKILFGIGKTVSIGCIRVNTPIGPVEVHIVPDNTLFLFCFKNMD